MATMHPPPGDEFTKNLTLLCANMKDLHFALKQLDVDNTAAVHYTAEKVRRDKAAFAEEQRLKRAQKEKEATAAAAAAAASALAEQQRLKLAQKEREAAAAAAAARAAAPPAASTAAGAAAPEPAHHLPVGLANRTATCYMNSAVQALATFSDFGENFKYAAGFVDRGNNSMAKSYNMLMERLFGNGVGGTLVPPAAPDVIDFLSGVYDLNPNLVRMKEGDASEFLLTLIDGIDQSLMAGSGVVGAMPLRPNSVDGDGKAIFVENDNNGVQVLQSEHSNIVALDLYSRTKITRRCKSRKHTWVAYDTEGPVIFLPIRKEILDPKTGLSFSPPQLEDINDFSQALSEQMTSYTPEQYCEQCEKETRLPEYGVWVSKKFTHIAPILIFSFVRNDNRGNKVAHAVDSKYQINMGMFAGGFDKNYDLVAVVHQMGTAGCGHYTASCLRDGRWLYFDDKKVSERGKPPEFDETVCILFYRLRIPVF